MSACPDIAEWEALAQGRAEAGRADELRAHLEHCGECREVLELVRRNAPVESGVREALAGPGTVRPASSLVGRALGRYQIVRVLGSGGMATVYEARQENPRRTLALKVLSRAIETGEVSRRFELEGQLLAGLSHPCIARIYETGSFEDDGGPRAFLAMELVRGQTIAEHCKSLKLSVRERMEILARVCDAVQHAHEHGIVHRDLKPSNIMIDEHGAPKVLDFGVARVTDASLGATMHTQTGQIVGTVAYMSPEQVDAPGGVDPRSDVYALGLIGYELATNRPGHDIAGKSLADAVEIIRTTDVTRAGSVDRALRGELETILATATDKEPSRRYQSARDFAADIRRWLTDQPIAAHAPSTWYQFRKFARRNRMLVGGVTAVLIALTLGLVGTGFGLLQARRQARVAEQQRSEAERRRATAESVTGLMEGMLRSANPHEVKGRGYTVRQLLDDFSRRFDQGLPDQPEVEATLRATLGNAYRLLGEYAPALPHLEAALSKRREVLAPTDPLIASSVCDLAWLLHDNSDYAGAEQRFREALDLQTRALGPGHPDLAQSLTGLADVLRHLSRLDEARSLAQRAVDLRRGSGVQDRAFAEALMHLARVEREAGDFGPSQVHLDEALAIFGAVLGDRDARLADALNDRAWLEFMRRDYAASEQILTRALDIEREQLGEHHPDTANSLYQLSYVRSGLGDVAESERLMREALASYTAAHGPTHVSVFTAQDALSRVLLTTGKVDEAVAMARASLEGRRALLGDKHLDVASAYDALGNALQRAGDLAGAEEASRSAIAAYRAAYGPDHPFEAIALRRLASIHRQRKEDSLAEQAEREALRIRRAKYGPDHADTLASEAGLARSLVALARVEEAIPLLEHAAEASRPVQPAWRRGDYLSQLSAAYRAANRAADARPVLEQAVSIYEGSVGKTHKATLTCMEELAGLLEQEGLAAEAGVLREEVARRRAEQPKP